MTQQRDSVKIGVGLLVVGALGFGGYLLTGSEPSRGVMSDAEPPSSLTATTPLDATVGAAALGNPPEQLAAATPSSAGQGAQGSSALEVTPEAPPIERVEAVAPGSEQALRRAGEGAGAEDMPCGADHPCLPFDIGEVSPERTREIAAGWYEIGIAERARLEERAHGFRERGETEAAERIEAQVAAISTRLREHAREHAEVMAEHGIVPEARDNPAAP